MTTYHPPVVACIGAGQLARMLATEAGELGFCLRVLADSPSDPAAFVCPETVVGSPDDPEALRELLDGADVVTFEHELIPDAVFDAAAAAGVPARPSHPALLYAKDKLAMRQRLGELGLPMPAWANGADLDAVKDVGRRCGWPLVAKISHGGYDGRGVRLVSSLDEFKTWREGLDEGIECLVEQRVPFSSELAVMAARRASGELRTYIPMQTWQEQGQCAAVLEPAPIPEDIIDQAEDLARQIGVELDITGVYAVEMFLVKTPNGKYRLYINELAMRPHNSGHWTQDGCVTSQFEQHLRAVLDLPLGDTSRTAPYTAMANVLGSKLDDPALAVTSVMEKYPEAKIHLYRKSNRPKRKLGHVNVCGTDPDLELSTARAAANLLMGK